MPAPDPFLPPDAGSEFLPELAELPTRVFPTTSPAPSAAADPPGLRRPLPVSRSVSLARSSIAERVRDGMADSPRARFAAGVAVAFFIGLVPAQIYAWSRAGSAYDDIRGDLLSEYRAAETPAAWAQLAGARHDAAELARSRQHRHAVSSCLLWLAAAGAAAFVWFRLIDWGPGPAGTPQPPGPPPAAASRRRTIT
jgi:hypothetical protein